MRGSAIYAKIDRKIFKKLGIGLTCDPVKK